MTDFEAARERAGEQGKPILANFSGSDWCGFCIRLEQEVFADEQFRQFAEEELVLLLIDFPRGKEQPQELQQQNLQLAQRYEVRGFPTIMLLNAKGEVLNQTGYRPGGVEKYLKHLAELLEEAEHESSGVDKPQPGCH